MTTSAGILLYRYTEDATEVLLVHPGGPFWMRKDDGAWSIPKGEIEPGEDEHTAALREFAEETGTELDDPELEPLGEVWLKSGKRVIAFAAEGDFDPATLVSQTFALPQGEFPEVDRAEWFDLDTARVKLNRAQAALIDRLDERS